MGKQKMFISMKKVLTVFTGIGFVLGFSFTIFGMIMFTVEITKPGTMEKILAAGLYFLIACFVCYIMSKTFFLEKVTTLLWFNNETRRDEHNNHFGKECRPSDFVYCNDNCFSEGCSGICSQRGIKRRRKHFMKNKRE